VTEKTVPDPVTSRHHCSNYYLSFRAESEKRYFPFKEISKKSKIAHFLLCALHLSLKVRPQTIATMKKMMS